VERFEIDCNHRKKMLKQSLFFSTISIRYIPQPEFLIKHAERISAKNYGIMSYLFTSESVSEGHPDKVSDQISDALLDEFLAFDSESKVAIETLVTTGQVVVAGEVKSKTYVDVQEVTRRVINKIGYTKGAYRFEGDSCGVLVAIHEQSPDINRGVDKADKKEQGAGDQGMMFGYACKDTDNYMPLALELSHLILKELAVIRREGKEMTYLRPDSKSQVTIQYSDENLPEKVHTIVVSTQHDEFDADEPMLAKIREDVINILIPRVKSGLPERVQQLFGNDIIYHVNPTGKFVIGGPHGDTGLTGRKIIVDTYGGRGAHGGGAFSGKDPSKVDRSAAYAARHIAKNLVAAGVADEVLVQLAYAIGVARPVGVFVNTYGRKNVNLTNGEIAQKVQEIFDLRPAAIEERLKLRNPIYLETAAYGHMGRTPVTVTKRYESMYESKPAVKEVELFTWEKLDFVKQIKETFGL
jgi:S-adenosylmethionine synthetase